MEIFEALLGLLLLFIGCWLIGYFKRKILGVRIPLWIAFTVIILFLVFILRSAVCSGARTSHLIERSNRFFLSK